MARFIVKGQTIRLGGKLYPPGTSIELTQAEAKGLEAFLEEAEGGAVTVEELMAELDTAREKNKLLLTECDTRGAAIEELTGQLHDKSVTNDQLIAELSAKGATIEKLTAELAELRAHPLQVVTAEAPLSTAPTESTEPTESKKGGKK